MSLWSWIRNVVFGELPEEARRTKIDPAQMPDSHSTTGTTPNQTFVGRAGGDDPGIDVESPEHKRSDETHGESD